MTNELSEGTCVKCGRHAYLGEDGQCWYCERAAAGDAMQIIPTQSRKFLFCRVCGESLRDKRKGAQFCSDRCRQKFHRAKNSGHEQRCAYCGDKFHSKRPAETCSPKCRQALYRLRKVTNSGTVESHDDYIDRYVPVVKIDQ